MAQFETFTKSLVALGRDPHLTIQRRGTITLNAAAFAALDTPTAVELLYNRDDAVLGLRSCDAGLGHAAFVRPSTKSPNGPFVVSAMAFLRYYEIDTGEARRYSAQLRSAVLCAELDGPFRAVSKRSANGPAKGPSDSGGRRKPRPRPR